MDNDINVELVQQQDTINKLKKSVKFLKIGLLLTYVLIIALIIAVAYLYYLKQTS